jgi:hypothetical protein
MIRLGLNTLSASGGLLEASFYLSISLHNKYLVEFA